MHKVESIFQEEVNALGILGAIDKLLATNDDQVELARNLGIARLSHFVRER